MRIAPTRPYLVGVFFSTFRHHDFFRSMPDKEAQNARNAVVSRRPLAAITGASAGLGKEYARQLAAMGYDLLLIARREPVLLEIKNDLEKQYGIHAETVPCDLSRPEQVHAMEERLERTGELEVMVNNAGYGRLDGRFPETDPDREEEMIRVHVISLMRLSRAALVPLCRRKKGYLINVSSVAAYLHGAGCCQYNATKAYVLSFSRSLQCDVRSHGVRIQALCPGLTHTDFHDTETMRGFQKEKTPGIAWLGADDVVRCSLRSVMKTKRVVCIPSLRYKIALCLLCNPIGYKITELIYAIRNRRDGS